MVYPYSAIFIACLFFHFLVISSPVYTPSSSFFCSCLFFFILAMPWVYCLTVHTIRNYSYCYELLGTVRNCYELFILFILF